MAESPDLYPRCGLQVSRRKRLIAAGMGVQAGAIALVTLGTTFAVWAVAALTAASGLVVAPLPTRLSCHPPGVDRGAFA